MSGGVRLPLAQAESLAHELVEQLSPACERIQIAGSIRRRKADIGDVEIVAIPRTEQRTQPLQDLFGSQTECEVNCLDELCVHMLASSGLAPRLNVEGKKSWGSQLKWGMYRGFAVDIYSATPQTWGVTLALRTGPAEFSKRLVTPQRQGGLCPGHLQFKDWRVVRRGDRLALETPEEEDVFNVLGYQFLPPDKRSPVAWPARLHEVLA